jgi:GTP-binding protein EngB required for normal cell division
VLLNKADKLSRGQAQARQQAVEQEITGEKWHAQAISFSARTGTGVQAAREVVSRLLR